MNCRRFQNRVFEYLDGTLPARVRAAADMHLAACPTCRQTVRQQQQLAESFSDKLRLATASLRLSPEARQRVLAAVSSERRTPSPRGSGDTFAQICASALSGRRQEIPREDRSILWLCRRLVWLIAMAASVLLAALLLHAFFFRGAARQEATRRQPGIARDAAWVRVSYMVPAYTFRREGDRVVDVLNYQTNVVTERL